MTVVTARTRIGWIEFRECVELLNGRKLSLTMKGRIHRSCVWSAMLYVSDKWCLWEKETAILKRIEKSTIRAMGGVKFFERKSRQELVNLLGLEETLNRLAKANGMRWYGQVLRRDTLMMMY